MKMPKVKANRYWNNHKNVDSAFDNLEKELGHIPTSREFRDVNECAFKAIANGRYNSDIKTWNAYLKKRDKETNVDLTNWSPKAIDEAFDTLERKLGKTPTSVEFHNLHGAALRAISKGRYNSDIKTWNDYLKHSGKLVLHDIGRWSSPNKIDEAFDRLEESLGRTPRRKDFVIKYAGALSAIVQGRYNKNIHYWNEYLMFRNRVINKKSGKDTTLILESLLEEGGTQ